MIKFIKKLFSKSEEDSEKTAGNLFKDDIKDLHIADCSTCVFRNDCKSVNEVNELCNYIIPLPDNFDNRKPSILLIDDNSGMVSFLEDDINFFMDKKVLDRNKINVLSISGSHAAFSFEALQHKYENLNIRWAVIDITLGGSIMTKDGNIRYTGVDIYAILKEFNPDAKFVFYTGNNLNPYIRTNERLIAQFKELSNGGDIKDHVLFKTSLDMDTRRDYICEKLFDRRKFDRRTGKSTSVPEERRS